MKKFLIKAVKGTIQRLKVTEKSQRELSEQIQESGESSEKSETSHMEQLVSLMRLINQEKDEWSEFNQALQDLPNEDKSKIPFNIKGNKMPDIMTRLYDGEKLVVPKIEELTEMPILDASRDTGAYWGTSRTTDASAFLMMQLSLQGHEYVLENWNSSPLLQTVKVPTEIVTLPNSMFNIDTDRGQALSMPHSWFALGGSRDVDILKDGAFDGSSFPSSIWGIPDGKDGISATTQDLLALHYVRNEEYKPEEWFAKTRLPNWRIETFEGLSPYFTDSSTNPDRAEAGDWVAFREFSNLEEEYGKNLGNRGNSGILLEKPAADGSMNILSANRGDYTAKTPHHVEGIGLSHWNLDSMHQGGKTHIMFLKPNPEMVDCQEQEGDSWEQVVTETLGDIEPGEYDF